MGCVDAYQVQWDTEGQSSKRDRNRIAGFRWYFLVDSTGGRGPGWAATKAAW